MSNEEKARTSFDALIRGRGWMKELPQAVFLHLHPILEGEERSIEFTRVSEGEKPLMSTPDGYTKNGFLFSYQGLVKREGESVSRNIYSGTKPAMPEHLHLHSGRKPSLRNASVYALCHVLWSLNHGKIDSLVLYCQPVVARILQGLIDDNIDIKEKYCHPKIRNILILLLMRSGPITIVPVTETDASKFRAKWAKVGGEVCRNLEDHYWKCWTEVLPIEWKSGMKGMTPRGKLVTENGRKYSDIRG